MKKFVLPLLALVAVFVIASAVDAGLFFRRDGSPRTPVRTLLANRAEARAARGAPVLFPRLRAAAASASCESSGSAAGGCQACGTSCDCSADIANACNDPGCLAEAARAFNEPLDTPESILQFRTNDAPRVTPGLLARERRLGPVERQIWRVVKDRPDLRQRVAAYATARGAGQIDPENLEQILQVLLAFFKELLPLILQLLG